MTITQSHNLPFNVAKLRIDQLLNDLQKKYAGTISNPQKSWQLNTMNFSFTIAGMSVKGHVQVEADKCTLTGDLPFLARFMEGTIKKNIKEQMAETLK
jgi:hypothetical protein